MKSHRLLRQEKSETFSAIRTHRSLRPEKKRPRRGTIWWAPAIAACLMWLVLLPRPSVALPWPFTPTPTPTPHATVEFYAMFYDTEGRAGLVPSWDYPTSPTSWTTIDVLNLVGSTSYTGTWVYDPFYDPALSGTPFDFEAEIPGVGLYHGTDFLDFKYGDNNVGYYPPYFVIPTTGERLGQRMQLPKSHLITGTPPNGQYVDLRILPPIVVPSGSLPEAGTSIFAAYFSVDMRVTVDHLPGSGLEYLGTTSTTLRLDDQIGEVALLWSGFSYPNWPYPDYYIWGISHEAPTGPVQVSVNIDGYTTDTILFEPVNLYTCEWTPLIHPLPNRPDVFRPGGVSIYRDIPDWMKTSIDQVKHGILYSAPADDQNNDAVLDVSDIAHILKSPLY